jgi:hypothetical protein
MAAVVEIERLTALCSQHPVAVGELVELLRSPSLGPSILSRHRRRSWCTWRSRTAMSDSRVLERAADRPARRPRSASHLLRAAAMPESRGPGTPGARSPTAVQAGRERVCYRMARCGKSSMCPELIAPLQIDLAIERGRYLSESMCGIIARRRTMTLLTCQGTCVRACGRSRSFDDAPPKMRHQRNRPANSGGLRLRASMGCGCRRRGEQRAWVSE